MSTVWTNILEDASGHAGVFLADLLPIAIVLVAMPLLMWVVGKLIEAVLKRGSK